MADAHKPIGDQMRDARIAAGYSYRRMAKKIGLKSGGYLCERELGGNPPEVLVRRYEQALGIKFVR